LPITGSTRAGAEAKLAELQALIDPRTGLSLLGADFGLSGYDLDGPLPGLGETRQTRSMRGMWAERSRRENLTIGQLCQLIAVASGRWLLAGTAGSIAGEMERWIAGGGCGGFSIMAPCMPGGLTELLGRVAPVSRPVRQGL
jgi:alkanesulfonate monooxygenase SsuD/methylene tetrahydromethanopterin reductase-like flavin-dependent oxidoreductase (luciferase family)